MRACYHVILNSSMILIALLLAACGQSENSESAHKTEKPIQYITLDKFKQLQSAHIDPIRSAIDALKQDVDALSILLSDINTKITMINDRQDAIASDNQHLVERESQTQTRVANLETEMQMHQQSIKALTQKQRAETIKSVKPVFPYAINDISLWGRHYRVSIKTNNGYRFAAIGDVIEQWRIASINMDKGVVSLIHLSGHPITRSVR